MERTKHDPGVVASNAASRDLSARLFVPQDRWGFEHTPPRPPAPSPYADRPPVWVEPALPGDFEKLRSRSRQAWIWLPVGLLISVWLLLMLSAWSIPEVIATIVFYTVVAATVVVVAVPKLRFGKAKRTHWQTRDMQVAKFEAAQTAWTNHLHDHDQAEKQRVATAMHWYPAAPSARRVDVFGGTPDGWAALLVTAGASILSSGAGLLVLDFSEHQVGVGLAGLATARTCPVAVVDLPTDTGRIGLLAGLSADEAAELIAEAAASRRSGDGDLHGVDAELVAAVAKRLGEPLTFARLDAGVRAMRGLYDSKAEKILTAAEEMSLGKVADKLAASARAVDQLQAVGSLLGLLAAEETVADTSADPVRLWPADGLAVLSTSSRHLRRKDALDRIVVARVLHELRAGHAERNDTIVVAGADHLGLAALEALSKQTRRCGVRLVLMLEHLRDDMIKLLGGSDSAAILMRLGNASEAAAAADFIGRGHKFVLSQLSEQAGRTLTHGNADTTGDSVGTTRTNTSGGTLGSTSTSVARTASWSSTISESIADSATTGLTHQRVYEYSVEPTTLQTLPPTAFILVEATASGRRVVAGDANPAIVLLDKIAPAARTVVAAGSTPVVAPAPPPSLGTQRASPPAVARPAPPGLIER